MNAEAQTPNTRRIRRYTLATMFAIVSVVCVWLAILRYDAQLFYGLALVVASTGWTWWRAALVKKLRFAELLRSTSNFIILTHEFLLCFLAFSVGIGLIVAHITSH